MARASRSSKKQPAFDPSELTDLIFSPAVGSGVGSHLVGTMEDFPALPDVASVDMSDVSTVAKSEATTVDINRMATVGGEDVTSVDRSHTATMDIYECATVASGDVSTVDTQELGREVGLWITEEGGVVPEGRVRQIRLAQDVISPSEAAVYDTLWSASKDSEAEGGEASRVVQAGYDYLAKHTELSKRTIQRIVEKLIDKDFIAIEKPADIYERSSTVYRVFSYGTVLERHVRKGRLHVAKVGPGFSYVRPLSEIRLQ
jgi:hypothetical protein